MSNTELTMVTKDYDHVAPLACGDVDVKGIDLIHERDTPNALGRTLNDPSIDVGEMSFSRHLIRLANGDRSIVGIPVFPTRGFRERCFFVLEDSELQDLTDLAGKRVGTNEWPATGNTWSRAVLRERGVSIDSINWSVGPVEDPNASPRSQGDLPDYVQQTGSDQFLVQMLHDGTLDAMMVPLPPRGLYDESDPLVRLFPDYRRVEKGYYRRTNVYPVHHLIGIRREVFERDPWVAQRIYEAMDRSKRLWQQNRRRLTDTTTWLLTEIEETMELIGEDWLPYGIESNRHAIEVLCEEEHAQGLIDEPIDPDTVFTEYEEQVGTAHE